jgi:hypothetical protein
MNPYREPAETLIDERFDIDIGKLDITVSYVSSLTPNGCTNTVRFQKFGRYSFSYTNTIITNICKPDVDSILSDYHTKGFITFIDNDHVVAIPLHSVIEITFKSSEHIVKIDPKTNKVYLDVIEWAKKNKLWETVK